MPEAVFKRKKISKERLCTISKMIQASVYQNPFYLRKIDTRKILQEHSQFKWCPSLSNDTDDATKRVQLICMSQMSEAALSNGNYRYLSGKMTELCRVLCEM